MAEHTIEEKKIRRFVNTGFRVTHQHTRLMKIFLTSSANVILKSRTLSRTSDTTETRNPSVIKVILLACFTYIDMF